MKRLMRLDPNVVDWGLAATLFVGMLVETLLTEERRGPVVLNLICVALITIPLGWRRRHPVGILLLFLVVAVVQNAALTDYAEVITPFFSLLVASYGAAAFVDGPVALAGLLVCLAAVNTVSALMGDNTVGDFLFPSLFVSAAWLAGRAVRARTLLAAELHEAAVRAEEERESHAERAMAEERRRIAREMHDVVAHSISVMVVQAGGARRILERDPGRAIEAAGRIEETGRAALVEMRRLLGVIKPGEGEAALAPQPTLDELDALVARARGAGLPVELTVEGERRPLPAGVDLAAYRVIQEALTNSLKYAGGAHTDVLLRYGEDDLVLRVADRGDGARAVNGAAAARDSSGGHGLVGMRERVALYGGELRAGPGVRGGFEIQARIPLEAEE